FEFLEEDVEVRSQELKMAASLIDSMTVDFDPAQYADHYREAVEELVEAKIEGHEVTAPPPPPEKPVTSLADALRASLAAAGDKSGRGEARRRGRSAWRCPPGQPCAPGLRCARGQRCPPGLRCAPGQRCPPGLRCAPGQRWAPGQPCAPGQRCAPGL